MSFFRRTSKPAAHVATSTSTPTVDQATAPVAVAERDALTGDYTIDASHSRLGFSARHAMVTTVRGQLSDFEGTAHVDAENPAASTVSLTIRPASISTGSADLPARVGPFRLSTPERRTPGTSAERSKSAGFSQQPQHSRATCQSFTSRTMT